MVHVDVGERRTRSIVFKAQRIPRRPAVAGEVHNGIAIGLSGTEHKDVVAVVALKNVGARSAVERVGTGIALDGVAEDSPADTMAGGTGNDTYVVDNAG